MTPKDQLTKIYSDAAWSLKHREGVRKLTSVQVSTKEDEELRWCYLGFMYDHLASPSKPIERHKMERCARDAYQQALQINSRCTTAMIGLGRILLNRNNPRALVWYRKAFQLDPDGPKVAFSLAYACSMLGEWNEAEGLFKKMWQKDRLCFGYAYNLASLFDRQGKKKQARYYATKALELFPALPRNERESEGGRGFKKAMQIILK